MNHFWTAKSTKMSWKINEAPLSPITWTEKLCSHGKNRITNHEEQHTTVTSSHQQHGSPQYLYPQYYYSIIMSWLSILTWGLHVSPSNQQSKRKICKCDTSTACCSGVTNINQFLFHSFDKPVQRSVDINHSTYRFTDNSLQPNHQRLMIRKLVQDGILYTTGWLITCLDMISFICNMYIIFLLGSVLGACKVLCNGWLQQASLTSFSQLHLPIVFWLNH